MKRISEVAGGPLEWSQPGAFKMRYELRAGDDLVAQLGFRSVFGSFATAQCADGSWTFKRVGFWQTRVSIREPDRDEEIGTFQNNVWKGGGGLQLAGGRPILATTNMWQSKLEFQNESSVPLVELKSRGVLHLAAAVTIQPGAVSMTELPLLTLLGWYLVVMMQQDASSAAAAAAG